MLQINLCGDIFCLQPIILYCDWLHIQCLLFLTFKQLYFYQDRSWIKSQKQIFFSTFYHIFPRQAQQLMLIQENKSCSVICGFKLWTQPFWRKKNTQSHHLKTLKQIQRFHKLWKHSTSILFLSSFLHCYFSLLECL